MAKEKKEEEVILPEVAPPVAMPTYYTKFENGKQEIVATEDLKEGETIAAGATTVSTTAAAKAEAKAQAEAQEKADKLAADNAAK